MVTLHEVITFLVSMQISISSLQTHNVNRCGRSRHLARKLSLRRKRSSPNVFEMAATETITSIILIKLIRVSLGTVRHPRRFKIVVIDIQITLKQMLRDFIGIRVNRAKKSGMVNITSSVNSRERSGINTILHELNPLFTINVTMRDIKSKNVYSRVNSKATTQWRKTERSEERFSRNAETDLVCRLLLEKKNVASLSDLNKLSRMGGRTIGIYLGTTVIALVIGLVIVNVMQSGRTVQVKMQEELQAKYQSSAEEGLEKAGEAAERGPLQPLVDFFSNNTSTTEIYTLSLHDALPIFYSRVNSKATTQWRKTESANGVHLEGVASDNRSS